MLGRREIQKLGYGFSGVRVVKLQRIQSEEKKTKTKEKEKKKWTKTMDMVQMKQKGESYSFFFTTMFLLSKSLMIMGLLRFLSTVPPLSNKTLFLELGSGVTEV